MRAIAEVALVVFGIPEVVGVDELVPVFADPAEGVIESPEGPYVRRLARFSPGRLLCPGQGEHEIVIPVDIGSFEKAPVAFGDGPGESYLFGDESHDLPPVFIDYQDDRLLVEFAELGSVSTLGDDKSGHVSPYGESGAGGGAVERSEDPRLKRCPGPLACEIPPHIAHHFAPID